MPINIHPVFVHFPIALLTAYSVLEIIVPEHWWPNFAWKSLRRFLLLAGTLAAGATYITGDMLEKYVTGEVGRRIVELHSSMAMVTLIIFGLLSVMEVVRILVEKNMAQSNGFVTFITACDRRGVRIGLALVGLASLTLTGALGATMVYGPGGDPLVKFLYERLAQ